MLKRIRVGQLRIGMYVTEIDLQRPQGQFVPFLIRNRRDLEKLIAACAISALIDTSRGIDAGNCDVTELSNLERFDQDIRTRFSAHEISDAKATIAVAAPMISELLATARNSTVDLSYATRAVSELMTSSFANAAALVSLARLKKRDEATFLHSLSVSMLMMTFGRSLGLDKDCVRDLGVGGLVHDIGKVKIPNEILNKSGTLSDEEYTIIKCHAEVGYKLLSKTDNVTHDVLDICRYHHERIDGTGYPHGLSGEAIPFVARIAAICDVYDALTTIRSYKPAWSQQRAVEWMISSTGQFDRTLLKSFVSGVVLKGAIG